MPRKYASRYPSKSRRSSFAAYAKKQVRSRLSNAYKAASAGLRSRRRVIRGRGAYTMSGVPTNSLFGKSSDVPAMHKSGNSTRIQHRELIGIVNSTTSFANSSYAINAGLSTTFPWLSRVASNYQTYKFNGLAFMFKTTCGNAVSSTNNSLGSVIQCVNYDSTQPMYANRVQAENSYGAIQSVTSCDSIFGIECANNQGVPMQANGLYVRTANQLINTDIRFTDMGLYQLCTDGSQAVNQIGELWVTYDVVLYNPTVQANSTSPSANSAHFSATSGVTNAIPLPVTSVVKSNAIGANISANNVLNLPPSSSAYMINILWIGSAADFVPPGISFNANTTGLLVLNNDTAYSISSSGTAATSGTLTLLCKPINTLLPIAITFGSAGVLPASVTSMDLVITSLPYEFA